MNTSESDPLDALLAEVRGETQSFDQAQWAQWSDTLGDWVEAYPAFGAGRLLRAKAARDGRDLKSADRLAQAAVFASVPGRLFDLMFRAGIESEIAAFARAVEALEPELESALKLRWHPEEVESPSPEEAENGPALVTEGDVEPADGETNVAKPSDQAPVEVTGQATDQEEGEEADQEEVQEAGNKADQEAVAKVEVPAEGTLAREVVLGAIERSIEKEINEVRNAALGADAADSPNAPNAEEESPLVARPFKVEWSETSEVGGQKTAVDLASLSPLARWAMERGRQTGFADRAESGSPAKQMGAAAEHIEKVLSSDVAGAEEVAEGGLEQQAALIDLFIRNEPVISPIQPDVERPSVKELAKESLVEDTSLITETMARIYAAQGQMGRARRAYKLLALKYPEKSVYFAAQSKKLGRKSAED